MYRMYKETDVPELCRIFNGQFASFDAGNPISFCRKRATSIALVLNISNKLTLYSLQIEVFDDGWILYISNFHIIGLYFLLDIFT